MAGPHPHWDPERLLHHIPREDAPGAVLLVDRAGRVLAGCGDSLHLLLGAGRALLGESIADLFPESPGNHGLMAAHTDALKGEIRSFRHRVGVLDVAWELSPLNRAALLNGDRGQEVLAIAIILGAGREIAPIPADPPPIDPVTGVPTREVIRAYAENMFTQNPREHWAVCRLNIGGLRRINYALGHDMGDIALRQAVLRIRSTLKEGEKFGREAGTEFTMLIRCETAQQAIDRIQAMIPLFDDPIAIGELRFMLNFAAGVALYPDDGTSADDLGRRAAIARERASRTGLTYAFFSAAFEEHLLAYGWVPGQLKRALRDREFILHYQPVIDTATGRTASLEALIRWRHPWRGMVPPGHFIPIAEETPFIVDLDMWVLERACCDAVAMDRPVSVNITAATLATPGFLARLDHILQRSGLTENWLTLELTERVFSTPEVILPLLQEVHEHGIQVAVDDFGVGYSSLSYLWQFPLDELKLDGSFVRAGTLDPRARNLVAGMVPLAKALGMTLVAECVETEQDHKWLQDVGIYLQQGFYFARPAPADEITR